MSILVYIYTSYTYKYKKKNIIFVFSGILLTYILNGRLDPGIPSPWCASEISESVCPL